MAQITNRLQRGHHLLHVLHFLRRSHSLDYLDSKASCAEMNGRMCSKASTDTIN